MSYAHVVKFKYVDRIHAAKLTAFVIMGDRLKCQSVRRLDCGRRWFDRFAAVMIVVFMGAERFICLQIQGEIAWHIGSVWIYYSCVVSARNGETGDVYKRQYMDKQKFYLLVPEEYYEDALRIYDSERQGKAIYDAGLVDLSLIHIC